MRIPGTDRVDWGSSLMQPQAQDDENKDPRVDMIRTVQHLIERCLLFRMDFHDCVETLSKHANIHPALTIAVWKGLLKDNGDFFRAYFINDVRLYNPPPPPPPAHTAEKYFSSHNSGKSTSHVSDGGPKPDFGRLTPRTF